MMIAGVALSGCGSAFAPDVTMAGVDAVSVINTEKTISDHVIGFVREKDCSTLRYQDGGEYCIEPSVYMKPKPQARYCYKTLGKVSCFTEPVGSTYDKPIAPPLPEQPVPIKQLRAGQVAR